jgi:hypothetical protein
MEEQVPFAFNPVVVVNGRVTRSDPKHMRRAGRRPRRVSDSMGAGEMVASSILAIVGLIAGAIAFIVFALAVLGAFT